MCHSVTDVLLEYGDLGNDVEPSLTPIDLASILLAAARKYPHTTQPQIPVVGRTKNYERTNRSFADYIVWETVGGSEEVFRTGENHFSGRIPLERLAVHLSNFSQTSDEEELLDLGTTLLESANGTPSSYATCQNLLALTADPNVALQFQVALIDRGQDALAKVPDDFNGKLNHVEKTDVVMDSHAIEVLAILLTQLDHYKLLPYCEILCALVKSPKAPVARQCFHHANMVEMAAALRKLRPNLKPTLPVVFNMSLGSHVGPHNGLSPLESYIGKMAPVSQQRYFHVAAGNDGGKGVADRKTVEPGFPELMKIKTGSNGKDVLLVEFWWEDTGSPVLIDVDVRCGGYLFIPKMRISSATQGGQLHRLRGLRIPNYPTIACSSLFHNKWRKRWNCVAFALSVPPNSGGMPVLDIEFNLSSTARAVVEAWLTVNDDVDTVFVEGRNDRTVRVPATSPDVIAVAGLDGGEPWSKSSRGVDRSTVHSPSLAQDVRPLSPGDSGTSYACPRACADTADALRAPADRTACTDVYSVVQKVLGKNIRAQWHPRIGYGSR